MKSDYRRENTS